MEHIQLIRMSYHYAKASESALYDPTGFAFQNPNNICPSPYALPQSEESWVYEKESGLSEAVYSKRR